MKDVISKAYKILSEVTPLQIDCGMLCDAACCSDLSDDEDEVTGMLLFPGEEAFFENCDWGYICNTEFALTNGKIIQLFVCEKYCPRDERPLSCRIFPLFSKMNGQVIIDPRSKGVCPLSCFKSDEEFSPEFVCAVKDAFAVLMTDAECKEFIEVINEEFKYYMF